MTSRSPSGCTPRRGPACSQPSSVTTTAEAPRTAGRKNRRFVHRLRMRCVEKHFQETSVEPQIPRLRSG
jgi:hypothetical protein